MTPFYLYRRLIFLKKLVIISGSGNAGKTQFLTEIPEYFSYSVDSLYAQTMERNYTVFEGKKRSGVSVQNNIVIPDNIKLSVITDFLKNNKIVVLEGRRFFNDYILHSCAALEGVSLYVVFVTISPEVFMEKLQESEYPSIEYLQDFKVCEYECQERFTNQQKRLGNEVSTIVDVTDPSNWDTVKQLIKSFIQEVPGNKVQVTPDLSKVDTGDKEMRQAINKLKRRNKKDSTAIEGIKRKSIVSLKPTQKSTDSSESILLQQKEQLTLEIKDLRRRLREGEDTEFQIKELRKQRRKIRALLRESSKE